MSTTPTPKEGTDTPDSAIKATATEQSTPALSVAQESAKNDAATGSTTKAAAAARPAAKTIQTAPGADATAKGVYAGATPISMEDRQKAAAGNDPQKMKVADNDPLGGMGLQSIANNATIAYGPTGNLPTGSPSNMSVKASEVGDKIRDDADADDDADANDDEPTKREAGKKKGKKDAASNK